MVIAKVTNFIINTIKNTINSKKPDAKRTGLTKFDPLSLRGHLFKSVNLLHNYQTESIS